MGDVLQQFALLDALLNNWDGMRIRMGLLSPVQQQELARLSTRLCAAQSSDEVAEITVDLLILTQDTAAENFVRDLIARSKLERTAMTRERVSLVEPSAFGTEAPSNVDEIVRKTGQELGRPMGADFALGSVPVFVATNRNPIPEAPPESSYGGELSELRFGLAQVTIPIEKHRLGKVETSHWWTPFPERNKEQRFVVLADLKPLSGDEFISRLDQSLPAGLSRDLLIFTHGYNVTFEEAVRRAAQLSYDLKFKGAVVLFTWPSLGHFWYYDADGDRAQASAKSLANVLAMFQSDRWNKIHMMAHSMGNRVLLASLAGYPRPKIPLKQVVFIAADVEVTLFEQMFDSLADLKPVTSYASQVDRALWLSRGFHKAQRVGYIDGEPFVTEGVETIDASNVDTSLLGLGIGHGYYGSVRAVLTDLGTLLSEGLAASNRHGLNPTAHKTDPRKMYWSFPR